MLQPGGTVALFWVFTEDCPFLSEVGKLFDVYHNKIQLIKDYTKDAQTHLENTFSQVVRKEYQENLPYSHQKYLDLICTYSWIIAMEEDKRNELLASVKEILKKQPKTIYIPTKYVLLLGK